MNNKKICIISFSEIISDARVLRQIKYLSQFYELFVIGYGKNPKISGKYRIHWNDLKKVKSETKQQIDTTNLYFRIKKLLLKRDFKKIRLSILYRLKIFSVFSKHLCEYLYWNNNLYKEAFKISLKLECDAFLANDWNALPIAAESAFTQNAFLIFDAHEYSLDQNRNFFKKLKKLPTRKYFLKKYIPLTDIFITVAPMIGKRYREEFGVSPHIIRNIPEKKIESYAKITDKKVIHIVHHGIAIERRHLDKYIESVALSDDRFHLHFYLIVHDEKYYERLKSMANDLAPKRIHFHKPVPTDDIIPTISRYDIGMCIFPPVTYNLRMCLPNKFFDFIQAGLGIIIGPSVEMVKIVNECCNGVITPSFKAIDITKTLNKLTFDDVVKMKLSSQEASKKLNAENEIKKLIKIFDDLFFNIIKSN